MKKIAIATFALLLVAGLTGCSTSAFYTKATCGTDCSGWTGDAYTTEGMAYMACPCSGCPCAAALKEGEKAHADCAHGMECPRFKTGPATTKHVDNVVHHYYWGRPPIRRAHAVKTGEIGHYEFVPIWQDRLLYP